MLVVYGRPTSSNVQKVLWLCEELGLPYSSANVVPPGKAKESADYVRLNPNGLIPTIDEDGFVLWESNAIVRYLAAKHANGSIFPSDLRVRADSDRWMDWQTTVLAPLASVLLNQIVRTPAEKRDNALIETTFKAIREKAGVLDAALAGRNYLAGNSFTMADIATGQWMWRYATLTPDRPKHANLEAWYARLQERPAFRKIVMQKLV
ncbi:MAG: glutathione S-transferase family protein [Proteobacteria bacterium]|nr:glutathione S-transferase family protein [Pseudomonadota bacterium]